MYLKKMNKKIELITNQLKEQKMQKQKSLNLNNSKILNLVNIILLAIAITACSSKKPIANNINKNIDINNNGNKVIYGNRKDVLFSNTIYFNFDSYEIKDNEKESLQLAAQYLNEERNKNINIKLNGYCDDLGTEQYNYELGLKRAEAVKDYLVKLGINESRIKIYSYGKKLQQAERESQRKVVNSRQLNRKVVISLE